MYLNFMFLDQSLFDIYYNVFKFHETRSVFFELSCKNTHGNTHTHTGTQTEAHNTVYEVSSTHVVAFCKNTTIINTTVKHTNNNTSILYKITTVERACKL